MLNYKISMYACMFMCVYVCTLWIFFFTSDGLAKVIYKLKLDNKEALFNWLKTNDRLYELKKYNRSSPNTFQVHMI